MYVCMYVCIMTAGRPKLYKNRTNFTSSVEYELYERFKEICWKERKPINALVQDFMEKYIKEHGNGNPMYELTKWVENPEFRATPAFRESEENWLRYINTETSYREARADYEKAFWIYRQYEPILDRFNKEGKRYSLW